MSKYRMHLRDAILPLVNRVPVSSMQLGSPRRIYDAASFADIYPGLAKYHRVRPGRPVNERPPQTIDNMVFFKYAELYNRRQPESFVLELADARTWGNKGAVISANDILIGDLSLEFGPAKYDSGKHSVFTRLRLGKPRKFKGTLAVVASPGCDVYAHWFCDVVPRFITLIESGLIAKVDKILINYSELDFQVDTLERLGVPVNKLWNCTKDLHFHLQADKMYVPSYPNLHGTVNDWACREVRRLFMHADVQKTGTRNLYISRARAEGRKLKNEDQVFFGLQDMYGFEKIFAEDLTLEEKVALFSEAACIVAPHGGGLTNILFCSTGCKIVDIFPPGDFDTFFWSMSNALGLQYSYLFGRGDLPTAENDFLMRNIDIDLEPETLRSLLELLAVKPATLL